LKVSFKKKGGQIPKLTNNAIIPIGYKPICWAPCTINGAATAPQRPNPSIKPIAVDWISGLNASVYKHPIKQLALTNKLIKKIPEKTLEIPTIKVEAYLFSSMNGMKYSNPTNMVNA
jgi:hypothetical protein